MIPIKNIEPIIAILIALFITAVFYMAFIDVDRCEKPIDQFSREDITHCKQQWEKENK